MSEQGFRAGRETPVILVLRDGQPPCLKTVVRMSTFSQTRSRAGIHARSDACEHSFQGRGCEQEAGQSAWLQWLIGWPLQWHGGEMVHNYECKTEQDNKVQRVRL